MARFGRISCGKPCSDLIPLNIPEKHHSETFLDAIVTKLAHEPCLVHRELGEYPLRHDLTK
jgi:hypothetical protein